MKLFSGLLSIICLLLAVSFALANRQDITIRLWPFGVEIQAPLYLMILGTLLLGLLLGAIIVWFVMLSYRIEAWRLRKDVSQLRDKIEDLKQTVLAPKSQKDMLPPLLKKPFWRFFK